MEEASELVASRREPTVSDWFSELRAPFVTASVIPVLVGGAVAWAALGELDLGLFALTMVGIVLLHLGANVNNEYWDYVGGTDVVNRNRTPFSGGSGRMVETDLPAKGVLRMGQALLAGGAACGLLLVYLLGEDGWVVLLLGMIGVGGAYFYSSPPLSLASRGAGEVVIWNMFGLLTVAGTYFVQARTVTFEAMAASVPVSFWIAAIIWVNQFPDVEADGSTGKRNIVVRIGVDSGISVYSALQVSAAAAIVGSVVLHLMPIAALLALVALVPAGRAIAILGTSRGHFPEVVPAQAMTVVAHLVGGLLLCTGLVL
jgi:1,4-dihydroxy-2-naphthoate octaprenyltransferase